MRLVSPFLKHIVYPGLSRSGCFRRTAGMQPAVLTYHGVLPAGYETIDPVLDGNLVSAESFRNQMRFLTSRYNVITPEEFQLWCAGKHKLSPRSVLLTCDDGLRNTLTDMLPILQEFGLSCLFFVTGASLSDTPTMLWFEELYLMLLEAPVRVSLELLESGVQAVAAGREEKRALWWELVKALSRFELNRRRALLERIRTQLGLSERWDSRYKEDPVWGRRFLMLNRSDMGRLADAGMCIGAHTMSHPVLSQLPPELAWREISESRCNLAQALGSEIWALAYPFGDSSSVSSRELQMAEQAGLKCAFLNGDESLGTGAQEFALSRVHVTAAMSLAELEAHVSGFHRSLRQFFRHESESAAVGVQA